MTRQQKITKYSTVAMALGQVGGLTYSFIKKKKFWGYVGYALLFGAILGTAAYAIAEVTVKEDKNN
jgi:uncharacterized membrane protein